MKKVARAPAASTLVCPRYVCPPSPCANAPQSREMGDDRCQTEAFVEVTENGTPRVIRRTVFQYDIHRSPPTDMFAAPKHTSD